MQNISGVGLTINLIASRTFPTGIQLTQFADDADPIDIQSIQIAEKAVGLNGDLLGWAKAVPVPCVLNIIPNSDDDTNLSILAENNRVGRGKVSTRDVITMTIMYPDGSTLLLDPGLITDAMFGKSVASAGRYKTKPYAFAFENMTRS